MRNSPFYDEFLVYEDNVDREMTTLPPDNTIGSEWLLSSPSTWNFSKIHLSNMNTKSLYLNGRRPITRIPRKAMASSMELQEQLSLSSYSSPSVMDLGDPFSDWRSSEISLVEEDKSNDGDKYQQPDTERWDSWFSPSDLESSRDLTGDIQQSPPRTLDSNLSTWNRNFGSANLSDLDVSKSLSYLQKSDATRPRPRNPYSQQKTPQPSYKAFPPITQRQNYTHESPHRPHKSWPLNPKTERPAPRARANTIPSNFKLNRPSNLSTCITLDNQSPSSSSSGGTPLYMCSPPTSRFEAPELMTYMSQQSYFFHDDEDDEQEKSWMEAQKQKWRSRVFNRENTPTLDEPPRLAPKPKKKISLGKSTAEALKEMFGRKKTSKVEKEKKEYKNCPKCNEVLERVEGGLMVTCLCRADLCFGCLRDWDFCDRACEPM